MHSVGEFCTSAENQSSPCYASHPFSTVTGGERGGAGRSTLGSQTWAAAPLQIVCRKIMGAFSFGYKELHSSYKKSSSENHNNTGKAKMEL